MLAPDCQMIDRRIFQEAEVLVGEGHDVTMLAGFECERDESFTERGIQVHRNSFHTSPSANVDGDRLHAIRAALGKVGWLHKLVNRVFMFALRRTVGLTPLERFMVDKAGRFEADVVHAHDLPVLRAGAVLAKRWGVPLVFDAHELYHAQGVHSAALRARCLRDEKELVPQASAVITVNEHLASRMRELYSIPVPLVIHNSVEPPATERIAAKDEPNGPLRRRVGSEGPIILYQGWLSHERNIETVIRAMALVEPPTRLAIIGYGEFESELREVAATANVSDRVHFLGRVPSDEILNYTVGADLGIIPYLPIDENHRYCSPNKFFEFTLSAVPVLAHDLAFFRSMNQDYGVVHCADLGRPETTAAAIRELLEGETLARMRQSCIDATPSLEWAVDAETLRQIYAGVATNDLLHVVEAVREERETGRHVL